jgi:VWFA-related protein
LKDVAATDSRWSWRRFRSSAAVAAAVLLTAAQTAPQFRARVDLVEIDVTVLDRDGRPVTNLTAADFEVRERGQLQRIDTIALMTADPALLSRAGAASAPVPAIDPPAPATPIVRPMPPRVFVFVFDMTHLSATGFTRSRTALRSFLEDGMRPGDLAGLVVDGVMLGNRIESDKAVMLKHLEGLPAPNLSRFNERRQWPRILSEEEAVAIARGDSRVLDAAVTRACQERPGDCAREGRQVVEREVDGKSRIIAAEAVRDGETTLKVLLTLANGLGRFPGPKQVVFLSEGFYTGEFAERVTQVAGLAARHRVRISTLDARGLATDPRAQDFLGAGPVQGTGDLAILGADADADVLTTLALETGGVRARHRNDLRPSLDAIATESGTFYLLGYSSSSPFDGSYRPVSVRVLRPDVTVRARRGYLAVETTSPPPSSVPPATSVPSAATAPPVPPVTAVASAATAPPVALAPPASEPLSLRPDATLSRNAGTVASRLAEPAGSTPERAVRLAREGWDRYSKGDVEGARERLAAAVEAGGSLWVRYALGLCELALRRPEAARDAFEFVRKAEPAFEGVYFDLADVYLQLGRPSEALAVLRDAARRWPDDSDAHNAVGVVLLRRGALDDAVESFARACSAAPSDPIGHFNLGYAHHLRYQRWLRTSPATPATASLAERARLSALEAYRKSASLGGSTEKAARDAIAALERR